MTDICEIVRKAKALESEGKRFDAEQLYSIHIANAWLMLNHPGFKKRQTKELSRDLAELLNERGILKRMDGRYEDSLTDYNESLKVLRENPDNEQIAFAYINIADIRRVGKKDFASAHTSLDEALTYSGNGTLMHAKAVDQRGLVFHNQLEDECAIRSYNRAIGICENLLRTQPENQEVQNRLAQAVHHLGVAYLSLSSKDPSKVDEAYQSQLKALEIFSRQNDLPGIVNAISTIGKIALTRNNPDEALKQNLVAEGILKKSEYKRQAAAIYLNIAELYLVKNDTKNAFPYLQKFCEGVTTKDIRDADIILIKDQFSKVARMYEEKLPDKRISNYEEVKNLFKSS